MSFVMTTRKMLGKAPGSHAGEKEARLAELWVAEVQTKYNFLHACVVAI